MKSKEIVYPVVKFFIRRGLSLFCREIQVSSPEIVNNSGPILLASNHPDSFLDAIIIGSRFSEPVFFLARGDAFRKPLVRKILNALKLIPIYRLSEGREYLALNDATFDRCNELFAQSGIILIFSEGLCLNQWQLRPLKKGTARIALTALQSPGMEQLLTIYPVSISYHSFRHFGKKVRIHFGEPLGKTDLITGSTEAVAIHRFNDRLSLRLQSGINANRTAMLEKKPTLKTRIGLFVLFPFALVGYLLNAPLYVFLSRFTAKKTAGTVFYDSVLFGLLLLSYPLYYLLMVIAGWLLPGSFFLIVALAMPFCAWTYTRWKDCRLSVFYSGQAN